MRVVVTGAAGFLGRALVRHLACHGTVVGIDRAAQTPRPGLVPVTADLLDGDPLVHEALADADAVFHLAGSTDVRDQRPDAAERRHRDNVLATETVLDAVPMRTRLLVTSSSSVYGGSRPGRPSTENDTPRPLGTYASSKLAVERRCARRHAAGGDVLVVRPFTVAGEGQRPGMGLARWIESARAGRPLRLLGSPERTRDLTDVMQVVRALAELAQAEATGTVNLGTGVGHSLAGMAAAVGRVLGVEVVTDVVPAPRVDVAHTLADTRRLREVLGWVPRTDLAELIARQAAATTDPVLAPAG
ncbi:NAD(P)-dependent oxidoreductase [Haloechinothrix sp. YIM 98757]|uniref:NAD(P)-dependent oxidoreductase n=1 Tax=Haloechinothrix aidingensis TaxID=2752311 RepID=A0A838A5Q2_9PSEU|nr:NAD(P)-dependent oxidoreductase [Haloechinothrix aidingensis]